MMFWLAIGMTVAANLGYNIFTKLAAPVHPLASLVVTYAVSLGTCLLLFPLFAKNQSLITEIGNINWAAPLLGVSIVLLETGFILAYRAGWHLGYAALFSNAAASLLLVPIAIYFFRDSFSLEKALGMALACTGLYLLSK